MEIFSLEVDPASELISMAVFENIREYIMEMFHITLRLKALKIELSEELLILMVLEERLKRDKSKSAHLANALKDKGCLSYRKPSDGERHFFVGDGKSVEVEAIGHFRLLLGTASWNGQQYFITFIDDYSYYGYLYLIHKKSQSLDMFKAYKAKVENQLKNVRFDHGGEYYGRYDGLAERPNRTLKDMVRSMIAHSTLPESLWGEALKTTAYILNRGCPVEARPYRLHEKKLDSKTVLIPIIDQEVNPKPLQYNVEQLSIQNEIDAMKDEYKSMQDNKVWELVPILESAKPIGCKWIFKTKRDANGNVERYKAHLVAKGYTQKEGINFTETFSPVSSKDSFRIIMVLVAHFDLRLHQMDVKTMFLNGDIEETIYMVQPENFELKDSKNMEFRYIEIDLEEMQKIPYASAVGSLMYAQVCTRPDIAYIVGMLGRYLSNPCIDHWVAAKRVMRYLQITKDYMLTFERSDLLEVIGCSDSDFARCQDSRKSTSSYIYLLVGGAIS
ncbi:hypothetical protein CXB51_008129 [Gossypium anomalum]|uniref:Reverse transcriptase Ty1/copia-type domain-containing protein n=1 Tax=Gossypium anomalum TaxID=47600 RepID=A0A8J5ZCS6_9ROSI|nr:hypothetical protein CXB51_008129 [Gossypium anomalum]